MPRGHALLRSWARSVHSSSCSVETSPRRVTPQPCAPSLGSPLQPSSRPTLLRWAFALFLLATITRLPALLFPNAIDDEAIYAVVATEIVEGGRPYVDAVASSSIPTAVGRWRSIQCAASMCFTT